MKQGTTIWVVDDSSFARLLLKDAIKDVEDVEIIELTNGLEAINKLVEYTPDLIILDSVMPGMNGIEVLESLKTMNLNIPVILCTADIQSTTKKKAISLNVKAVINKPINKAKLHGTVVKLLNQ